MELSDSQRRMITMDEGQQLIGVLKEVMEEEFDRENKEHMGFKVKDDYMVATVDQFFYRIDNQLPDDELFALPTNLTEMFKMLVNFMESEAGQKYAKPH